MLTSRPLTGSLIILAYLASPSAIVAQERGVPVFDGRQWELGWSDNRGGTVLEEYVLKGEVVQNWSELVTIQFYPKVTTGLDVFEAGAKRDLSKICPHIQWTPVYQKQDERIPTDVAETWIAKLQAFSVASVPMRWAITGRGMYSESIGLLDQQSVLALGDLTPQ